MIIAAFNIIEINRNHATFEGIEFNGVKGIMHNGFRPDGRPSVLRLTARELRNIKAGEKQYFEFTPRNGTKKEKKLLSLETHLPGESVRVQVGDLRVEVDIVHLLNTEAGIDKGMLKMKIDEFNQLLNLLEGRTG
jgi:hypothetical protein